MPEDLELWKTSTGCTQCMQGQKYNLNYTAISKGVSKSFSIENQSVGARQLAEPSPQNFTSTQPPPPPALPS